MKKKIVSIALLLVYFFGGMTLVFANTGTTTEPDPMAEALKANQEGSAEREAAIDARREESLKEMSNTSSDSPAPSGGSSDMTSAGFKFDVSDLSPSEKQYKDGTKLNLKNILANIGKYLLIATTTIAVLSLVIGGLMISTTGPSDRAAKGKTIIVLNITAIVIALLSYSIIRLVSWLIA